MVQYYTVNQFGVLYRTADLLDDANVSEIDIGGSRGSKTSHCGDSDGGKGRGVLRDDLNDKCGQTTILSSLSAEVTHFGVEGRSSSAEKRGLVVEVNGGRQLGQVLNRLCGGFLEGLCDDGGMDALLQHLLRRAKKASCKNDNRRSAIPSLYILCSRKIDKLITCEGVWRFYT